MSIRSELKRVTALALPNGGPPTARFAWVLLALALAVSANHSAWIDDYLGRPARQLLLRGRSLSASDPGLREFAGRYDESPWTRQTWLLPWGEALLMLPRPAL